MFETYLIEWDPAHSADPSVFVTAGDDPAPEPTRRLISTCRGEGGSFCLLEGYLLDVVGLERTVDESPAESILRAYQRWGFEAFDRFRGGYVAVIWEAPRRRLHIGRDAVGLHACYYARRGRGALVSSSIDVLQGRLSAAASFNPVTIAEMLAQRVGSQQREETFFEGIQRLPGAHVMTLEHDRDPQVRRFWEPFPSERDWATDDEEADLIPCLDRAVGRCLRAGADSLALSGGFDSISLAVLATDQLEEHQRLHAVSLHIDDHEIDESDAQIAVARKLGMTQTISSVKEILAGRGFLEASLEFSARSPSPVASVFQSAFTGLMAMAGRSGSRRMLMGTGGDEMLTVDPVYAADLFVSFQYLRMWQFLRSWQRSSPLSAGHVARILLWNSGARPTLGHAARRALESISMPLAETVRRRRYRRCIPSWLNLANHELITEMETRAVVSSRAERVTPGKYYRTRMNRLLCSPLHMLGMDQAFAWGRAHGFVQFYPFLDRDVVELALRIHPRRLIEGGFSKAPLRRLVHDRLPFISRGGKKVDFSGTTSRMVQDGGAAAWSRLGGPSILSELGIVDDARTSELMDGFFAGRDPWTFDVWLILTMEDWLQAQIRHCDADKPIIRALAPGSEGISEVGPRIL